MVIPAISPPPPPPHPRLTSAVTCRHAVERHHPEVEPLLQPQLVHDADHLDGQHVLPQIVSHLVNHRQRLAIILSATELDPQRQRVGGEVGAGGDVDATHLQRRVQRQRGRCPLQRLTEQLQGPHQLPQTERLLGGLDALRRLVQALTTDGGRPSGGMNE